MSHFAEKEFGGAAVHIDELSPVEIAALRYVGLTDETALEFALGCVAFEHQATKAVFVEFRLFHVDHDFTDDALAIHLVGERAGGALQHQAHIVDGADAAHERFPDTALLCQLCQGACGLPCVGGCERWYGGQGHNGYQ